MTWRLATYNNDLEGIVNATCGVFLYDMDNIDDGSAFEIGNVVSQSTQLTLNME